MSCNVNTTLGERQEPSQGVLGVRLCELCGVEISAARLAAMPYTNRCTLCTELSGDVTPIRRYDDPGVDGSVEPIYYKEPNQYLKTILERGVRIVTSVEG